MTILGIDPGLQTTGFGLVEWHNGQLRYIASGTVHRGFDELPIARE